MLTEADREEIARRLIYLKDEMADSRLYRGTTWDMYQTDRRKRRELERWVENIVNCIIDISKVIIGSCDVPVPETYRDTLKTMDVTGVFRKGLGESLSRWARLRNVLAREYLDIRWDTIKVFLKEVDGLMKEFMAGVERFVKNDANDQR